MNKLDYIKRNNSEYCSFYEFTKPNKKGEKLTIEVSRCYVDLKNKNCLPNLWKKHGYTEKLLNNYICIHTYVTDEKGNCTESYNPTIKLSNDKKRHVINFDYYMEATPENEQKLIEEVYKYFKRGYYKMEVETC